MKLSSAAVSFAVIFAMAVVVQQCGAVWSPTIPRYLHISMVGNPYGMAVAWFTMDNTSSVVQYGEVSNQYTGYATGYELNYLAGAGYHHHVVLTGLSANTVYYYRVGDNITWSYEASFITPPDVETPFKIGVYGDMGVAFSQDTIKQMHTLTSSGDLNWIWHIGDISYADDYATVFSFLYEPIWNMWFDLVEPTTSSVPYMVLPGNHEFSCENPACNNYSKNFVAFNNRFRVPSAESNSTSNMWYSFDYSNVHFVCIDTETDYPNAPFNVSDFGDQLAWLKSDLASVNRDATPWVFVAGHRPIYSAARNFSVNNIPFNQSRYIQQAFEPLFAEYGVDLFIAGHVHAYERQYPVVNSTVTSTSYVNPKSTVHLITGAAGNIEWHTNTYQNPLPIWNAFVDDTDFGFGTITVFNSTHILWQWIESDNGEVIDEVYIVKDA